MDITNIIEFKNVTKIYPPATPVLQDISFAVKKGEFVSIVGKSGAGKTTLLRLILGLEAPTYGDILFDGRNINRISNAELQKIRRRIGVIYQDYKLLSTRTVYENVAYIMEVEGKDNDEIDTEVPKVLEAIGLKEKLYHFPRELSGGEQQRLAIARALVSNPDFIIADEPTGNLDPYNSYEVISFLEKINQSGKTVVLSTHDREIINRLNKRVIVIENGKVLRDEENGKFVL